MFASRLFSFPWLLGYRSQGHQVFQVVDCDSRKKLIITKLWIVFVSLSLSLSQKKKKKDFYANDFLMISKTLSQFISSLLDFYFDYFQLV